MVSHSQSRLGRGILLWAAQSRTLKTDSRGSISTPCSVLWGMFARRFGLPIGRRGFPRARFFLGRTQPRLLLEMVVAWKSTVKKILWPRFFRLADQVIVPSSGTRDLMVSLGLPAERVTLTPYSVDNDWWMQQSAAVDRSAARASWGASASDAVILFCAKLQPWKRPRRSASRFCES